MAAEIHKIKKILEKIRLSLKADGGDIELIDYDEAKGVVKVSMTGHCAHCSMADFTLEGITEELKKTVPGVKKVINK